MQSDYKEKSAIYFSHVRYDALDTLDKYFSKDSLSGKRILEIGCGGSPTGRIIKEKYAPKDYIGIEYVDEAAQVARQNIDYCYTGKAEDILSTELKDEKFDLIIFLDVLEHLYDPWEMINISKAHLNIEGHILASIPNMANYEMLYKIITDKFEYNPNGGLFDSTHIRWFTKHTILSLFKDLNIISCKGKIVPFKKRRNQILAKFLKPIFKRFLIIQYMVVAKV